MRKLICDICKQEISEEDRIRSRRFVIYDNTSRCDLCETCRVQLHNWMTDYKEYIVMKVEGLYKYYEYHYLHCI